MNITATTQLYAQAIEKWGYKAQACMVMGECGELTAAVNQFFIQGRTDKRDQVLDEMADVSIMIDQLKFMLEAGPKFEQIKQQKLNRLAGIIAGAIQHPHQEA
ncbi:hypothetical protein [Pseudoalteromonas rubra]|uniref:Uncharacterized protein n=1 Tax=Pseudoalteromonas rubra TaxID=43658 RepID=A0A0U3GFN0_9GAMM|nr:hypothetical protein [Pseudoalteromonas rubra]ALU41915.1 hypothetical protein AT705_02610 [Pseudoalteromonas rubra]